MVLALAGVMAKPAWPETAAPGQAGSPAGAYCLDIVDKAADARVARQAVRLKELEASLESRIRELEQRRDEVRQWVEQQKKLLEAAEAGLVAIYARMEPEAAAGQIALLDSRLAVSVLHQLKPREASAILNVMKAERAAELVRLLIVAGRSEDRDKTP